VSFAPLKLRAGLGSLSRSGRAGTMSPGGDGMVRMLGLRPDRQVEILGVGAWARKRRRESICVSCCMDGLGLSAFSFGLSLRLCRFAVQAGLG